MPTQYLKMGYEDRVIREDGFYPLLVNGKPAGFNLDLRINYYRGLPLSCVRKLEVTIDGKTIPERQMLGELNGKQFTVSQMKDMPMEFWGLKTPMHLRVYDYELEPGEHDVSVDLNFKSPYMKFGPGVYGEIPSPGSKKMKLGEGREL